MLSMLLAYDNDGNVIGTLDHMVSTDDAGNVVGLIDFDAHELAGGEHTDIWQVDDAKGSKTWPEWLGAQAHAFRVELQGPPGHKRISALVHRESGHRRERLGVETAVSQRIAAAKGTPADVRDLLGGPDRPLTLDEQGRTVPRKPRQRTSLPMLAGRAES